MSTEKLFAKQCFVFGILLAACLATAADSKVEDLLSMQDDYKDGIIHFDSSSFNTYVSGKSRSYSVVLMLTAKHLLDKPQLQLRSLRQQYGLFASKAVQHLDDSGKVFFGEIEFNESKDLFQRLAVTMLPMIVRIPPALSIDPKDALKLKEEEKMTHQTFPNYPWSANDIAKFVTDRTGISFPEIRNPTLFEKPEFPWIAAAALAVLTVVGYYLYYTPFIRWKGLYLFGCLVVYWFAVSGGMYNIIRSMPMYIPKQDGTFQLFLQNQGQLGAEGFIMGSHYTGCGTAFALCALAATRIKSITGRRIVCYACLLAGAFCMKGVVDTYKWKTGYGVRTYLFG